MRDELDVEYGRGPVDLSTGDQELVRRESDRGRVPARYGGPGGLILFIVGLEVHQIESRGPHRSKPQFLHYGYRDR